MVELVTKEYNTDKYFMPVNQYIIETFDDKNGTIRGKNQYHINIMNRENAQILIEMSPEYNDIDIEFDNIEKDHLDISINPITGFKKYRINYCSSNNVYFNVTNPGHRNANYMIRHFYTEYEKEQFYSLDDKIEKNTFNINDKIATVSLTFNNIKITYVNKTDVNRSDVHFYIFGFLYNAKDNNGELINTTAIFHERKALHENRTLTKYNPANPEKFTLVFQNVSREKDFLYDVQLQVNVKIQDNIFNEEFLAFTFKVNLSEIKFEEEEESKWWIILISVIAGILLIVIILFIIKYIRLKRSNVNLKENLKSMAFSNDVQKNVIIQEKKFAEKESDYETTFI